MIDASKIYTAKRAQNVMEPKDIDEIYNLFISYKIVDKSVIVDKETIKVNGYNLELKNYIHKKEIIKASYEKVVSDYLTSVESVIKAEEIMKKALLEEGFVHE